MSDLYRRAEGILYSYRENFSQLLQVREQIAEHERGDISGAGYVSVMAESHCPNKPVERWTEKMLSLREREKKLQSQIAMVERFREILRDLSTGNPDYADMWRIVEEVYIGGESLVRYLRWSGLSKKRLRNLRSRIVWKFINAVVSRV